MIRMPVLETPRLLLLPSHPRMARQVLDFYRRNGQRLQPVEPRYPADFFTLSFQRAQLRQERAAARRGEGVRYWMILRDEPGRVWGSVALSGIFYGSFRSCMIAYKTDGALLRQGYGAEAVEAVVDFAFRGLLLHRVEAHIMPRNTASLALARHCGFQEDGRSPAYLSINGVWEEHIHMVRLNEMPTEQEERNRKNES